MGSRSRAPRSSLGGVPTTLPAPAVPEPRQLPLGLTAAPADGDAGPHRTEPLQDVMLLRDWLTLTEQQALVEQFRSWAAPPAGLRHPRVPQGHVMSVQSVCLGWHWSPYSYSRTADDTDGAPVKPMPAGLAALRHRGVVDCYGEGHPFTTGIALDAALVTLYAPGAHLGLHQDGEEPSAAPVVTISLGDDCIFRMAGVERRTGPFTDVLLHSGDLLVFAGAHRRVFHGVPKVHPGTAPPGLGLPPGRLSITLRETGFGAAAADQDSGTDPGGVRPSSS